MTHQLKNVPLHEILQKWVISGLKALWPNEGGSQKSEKSGANCRTRVTIFRTILRRALLPVILLATSFSASATNIEGYQLPMQGWKIMQQDYNKNSYLDAISFEWDYFMIHSATWNGIVGYVLANPRGRAPYLGWALLPNGNNVGVVGEIPGQKPIANYVNFGIDNTSINATERAMKAVAANGTYADYKALPGGGPSGEPAFQLKGKTADWEWNFLVTQDHADRDVQRQSTGAFTTAFGTDVGLLPEEEWNVDMTWPRTNVVGTVKRLSTGQVINVNGKGYREDSWGRYLLSVDGWDFLVFGEDTAKGVMGSWQTYHKSDKMDYLDMSFYDNGQLVSQRFFSYKNQMGWVHPNWKWDGEANSCVPTNTKIVAKNSQYTVEINANIGSRQRPILSSQTVGVGIFFYPGAVSDSDRNHQACQRNRSQHLCDACRRRILAYSRCINALEIGSLV